MPEELKRRRSAREVIDQAIAENKDIERFLYAFAAGFAALGAGILILGAKDGHELIAVAGAVCAALFLPSIHLARRTSRENIAIRLLEVSLAKSETPAQAAEAIKRLVQEMFREPTSLIDVYLKKLAPHDKLGNATKRAQA